MDMFYLAQLRQSLKNRKPAQAPVQILVLEFTEQGAPMGRTYEIMDIIRTKDGKILLVKSPTVVNSDRWSDVYDVKAPDGTK
jgi:hypothetical protein